MSEQADFSFRFRLRDVDGTVHVRYGVNDEPRRWGYEVLGLDWYDEDLVRGFPIMEASVQHPAEGYAAQMGWIQVTRYEVRDPGEEERTTVFDVPPQLSETESPYFGFGVRPTVFDAPSITSREVTWRASTFLTCTPDALLSRVIRPLFGFNWGYDVTGGNVSIAPIAAVSADGWVGNLSGLRERFPTWSFLDVASWDEHANERT